MKFDLKSLATFTERFQVRLQYDTWASVDKRFFYINTPKAGCTKVKKVLQELCDFPVPEGSSLIHARQNGTFVKSLLDFTKEEQLYLLNDPEVTRFCFVRNPYTRVISTYRNKVVGPKKYGNIIERLKARRKEDNDSLPSFKEFLLFLDQRNDKWRDIHWRTQSRILYFDKIDYNFIGYFENFQEDLRKLLIKLNAPKNIINNISVKENDSGNNNVLESINVNDFLDVNKNDLVYKAYKDDFRIFGYAKRKEKEWNLELRK